MSCWMPVSTWALRSRSKVRSINLAVWSMNWLKLILLLKNKSRSRGGCRRPAMLLFENLFAQAKLLHFVVQAPWVDSCNPGRLAHAAPCFGECAFKINALNLSHDFFLEF